MGIGTFGVFTQAKLAIYAAQTGISVTGNNISNINTPGYTRQRLNQVSLYTAGSDKWYAQGDVRAGQGVLAKSISQIRSPYLDIRFREESAKVGYQNAKLEGLNSIAQILDEVGKGVDDEKGFGVVAMEISKLVSALQDLTKETGHQEYDNIVRQVASNLVSRLNSYAARLEEVRQNTITSLNKNVDRVNDILTSIRSYNEEIRKCDIHGDPALELRDERNLLLDELSGLIDISVTYEEEEIAAGLSVEKLIIHLGNANPDARVHTDEALLVDGIFCAQLSMGEPVKNPYYGVESGTEEYLRLRSSLMKSMGLQDAFENTPPVGTPEQWEKLRNQLELYTTAMFWNGQVDSEGNAVFGQGDPVHSVEDATILEGQGDSYYWMTVTELRNKIGEVHQSMEKYASEKIEDDVEVKDPQGNLTKIADLFKDAVKIVSSVSVEEKDVPTEGDTTIMIYRRFQAADEYGHLLYEMEEAKDEGGQTIIGEDGKPVMKQKLDANGKPIPIYEYRAQKYIQRASKPVVLDDNDLGGELQGNRELLTEKGEFIEQSVVKDMDENAAGKRGIQYYQRSLDLLANQLATMFNDANQGFLMGPDGNYIYEGEDGKAQPVTLPSGTPLGKNTVIKEMTLADKKEFMKTVGFNYIDTLTDEELEKAINTTLDNLDREGITNQDLINAYLNGQIYHTEWVDIDGTLTGTSKYVLLDDITVEGTRGIPAGGILFSNGNNSNDPTGITAANISISAKWQTSHILVRSFTCVDGELAPASGDSENILHMKYLMDTKKWDFFPNTLDSTGNASEAPMFNGTMFEYWNNVGFTMGKDQDYCNTELTVAYETALSIDTDRSSVSSVDFNDEAMNLMMYSKSYNAACRLMTTIDSMIDKLINGTGLTT